VTASDRERRRIEDGDDLDAAVALLRQLWTDADPATIREWVADDDYELLGVAVERSLVAVAGVSVQGVMHHERHAWVHDLVVDESRRGEGHGEALLGAVEDWARERDCATVSLASRLENDLASGFYEATGYEPWGYVYERRLE
jgi:GNAT superfamily N-acetyltransferase